MKRYRKIIFIAVFFIVALFHYGINAALSASKNTDQDSGTYYSVERVVDGDTLKLTSGDRIRLIGIDTPEVHYSNKLLRDSKKSGTDIKDIQQLGKQASDFTKKLVGRKKVWLEFDVERKDKYGRLLAYVYLEDGTFVNAEIMKEGYGQVMTIPPNVKYADYFAKLQKEAREGAKGLWR